MPNPILRVLLVEDDEVVRTSMRFALESRHLQVSEADTVAEGIRCFHAMKPDVVVIDLHLPDGTGYDLALWLWQRNPQLPLVMISTNFATAGRPQPRPRSDRQLVLLAKPFSASGLLDAISRAAVEPARGLVDPAVL